MAAILLLHSLPLQQESSYMCQQIRSIWLATQLLCPIMLQLLFHNLICNFIAIFHWHEMKALMFDPTTC